MLATQTSMLLLLDLPYVMSMEGFFNQGSTKVSDMTACTQVNTQQTKKKRKQMTCKMSEWACPPKKK